VSEPFRRRVARIALVAAVLWLGLPMAGMHPGLNDDTACGLESGAPGGSQTLRGPATVNPLQHCAICHLQRASSGAQAAPPVDTITPENWTLAGLAEPSRVVPVSPPDRQPARAPPSLLHS
jgi:hypothetical protein